MTSVLEVLAIMRPIYQGFLRAPLLAAAIATENTKIDDALVDLADIVLGDPEIGMESALQLIEILKPIYYEVLREPLKKAVEDHDAPINEVAFNMLDLVMGDSCE